MEVTVEFQNSGKSSLENKPVSNQSPLDHQLENVTKMIEASTLDLQEKTQYEGKISLLISHFKVLVKLFFLSLFNFYN